MFEAARLTDPIAHTSALKGFLIGAVIGIALIAAVAFATFTCGFGVALLAGAAAAIGASSILELGEAWGRARSSPSGTITSGSPNVFTNGLPAAFATASTVACDKHNPVPLVAEGSTNVWINGKPAARVEDAITCGAKIDSGSHNVFIGGGKKRYMEVADEISASLRKKVDVAFMLAGLVGGVGGLLKAGGGISRAMLPCAAKYVGGFVLGEAAMRYVVAPVASRVMGGLMGNPVEVATGRKVLLAENEIDFVVQSPIPLIGARFYASNLTREGTLGKGWVLPWDLHLQQRDGKIWLTDSQGRETGYPQLQPGHTAFSPTEQSYLACTHDSRYILYDLTENYYDFGYLDINASGTAWVQRVEDRTGQWHAYTRDDRDRVVSIRSSGGQQLGLHYNQLTSRLTEVVRTHEGGSPRVLVKYSYDALAQLVAVTDANDIATRKFSYANGLMVSHTSALGFTCSYVWTEIAGLPRVASSQTSEGERTIFRYDPDKRQSWAEDEQGRNIHWTYDTDFQIVECTDLDGGKYYIEYNEAGMPTRFRLPGERRVTFAYDAALRIISEIDPLGRVTLTNYDANSLRISQLTLPDGSCWRAEYDYLGRLLNATDPLGRQVAYEYPDELSEMPLVHIDARGGRQYMKWDQRGQLVTYTDCSGKTTHYQYDENGQVASVTNALGQTTLYERLPTGEPSKITFADGSVVERKYDAAGLLIDERSTAQQVRQFVRNTRGQVTHAINSGQRHLRYFYDVQGKLVELATDETTRYLFSYDIGDLLAKETRPDGIERLMRYDQAGSLLAIEEIGSVQTPAGSERPRRKTFFKRDKMGRLLALQNGTASYVYIKDDGDRLIEAIRTPTDEGKKLGVTASTVRFDYDKAGRMLAEHGNEGVVGYVLDELDNLVSLNLPHGQRIDTLTYGSGHVHQIRSGGQLVIDFERDDLHREVAHSQGSLIQRVGYDVIGRRVWQAAGSEFNALGPGRGILWRSYRYHATGELAEQRDSVRGAIEFQYDQAGQLHKQSRRDDELQEKFAWDAAGNLLDEAARKSRGHVAGNRLMVWQDFRFEYDAWGNLCTKRKGAHHVQRFSFDAEDRLIRVFTENLRGTTETHFEYDALGRRIVSRETHALAGNGAHTVVKRFVWQELRMVQEVRDGGVSSYIYSPDAAYTPLARVDAVIAAATTAVAIQAAQNSSRVYHFHTDLVGAPLEVTNGAGQLAWAGKYKAWGRVDSGEEVAMTGQIDQPLRYPGQYSDQGTGLHYNTFRFYDPDVGRFISQDPIGLAGGDNLYAYAPNPTGWIDPQGLTTCMMSTADKAAMGPHPLGMNKPHLHHIIREMAPKRWKAVNRQYILDVQALAAKYGIDINRDIRNFTWAENGNGAHGIAAAKHVATRLKAADLQGLAAFESELKVLGTEMANGIFF